MDLPLTDILTPSDLITEYNIKCFLLTHIMIYKFMLYDVLWKLSSQKWFARSDQKYLISPKRNYSSEVFPKWFLELFECFKRTIKH